MKRALIAALTLAASSGALWAAPSPPAGETSAIRRPRYKRARSSRETDGARAVLSDLRVTWFVSLEVPRLPPHHPLGMTARSFPLQ